MDIMAKIMEDITAELEKEIPADVIADLKELSKLQTDVFMCLGRNKIIDSGKIKKINELLRKHFYNGEQDQETTAPVKTFDFGEAIRRMKTGARVARTGWNGKGMFVMLCKAAGEPYTLSDGMEVTRRDYLYMKAADNTVVPWVASQTDILAEDWYEVYKVKKEADKDA